MQNNLLRKNLLRIEKKVKKLKYRLEKVYTKIYIKHCRIDRRKVVFDNFSGKGYADNPKYIAEEILRQNLNWNLVWLTNDLNGTFPLDIKVVKHDSLKAMRELASAKVWIDNVRSAMRPEKKTEQIYLQTWHGGFGFKKVEGAIEDCLSEEYVILAKRDGAETNAIISACDRQTENFLQNFWLNKQAEILEIGQPRNDILFNVNKDEIKQKINTRFGISKETRVILYAPTFRDDFSTECYNIDTRAIIDAFEKKYGGPFVIFVRFHPNAQRLEKCLTYSNNVINVTNYPDIQELYFMADFLISDFSSVPFDFSLLYKPVFLHVPDYKKYEEERGLLLRPEETPFLVSQTNMELVNNIKKFSYDDYFKQFEQFRNDFWGPYDKGTASYEAVEWIKEKLQE